MSILSNKTKNEIECKILVNGVLKSITFCTDNIITETFVLEKRCNVIKKNPPLSDGELIKKNVLVSIINEAYGGNKYLVLTENYEKICSLDELQEIITL